MYTGRLYNTLVDGEEMEPAMKNENQKSMKIC